MVDHIYNLLYKCGKISLTGCKNKSGFQQNINMVKIFFPLLGVDFSELCNIALTLCHHSVNKIIEQNWSHNLSLLLPLFTFLFFGMATVVLADEADCHLRVRDRFECRSYN
jgi:hypothetical protein